MTFCLRVRVCTFLHKYMNVNNLAQSQKPEPSKSKVHLGKCAAYQSSICANVLFLLSEMLAQSGAQICTCTRDHVI